MPTLQDVHQQFASFFPAPVLRPLAYLLSRKLAAGHICIRLNELNEGESTDAALPDLSIEKLLEEKLIAKAGEEKQPFILQGNRLYIQRYFHYESLILQRILALIKGEADLLKERMEQLQQQSELIRTLFPAHPEAAEPDWQLIAALNALLHNFSIITGGPGTGKTTTVAKILAILFAQHPDYKVMLAAPTGKAASRMAESLKASGSGMAAGLAEKFASLEPSTIHRLLKTIPDSPYFRHHAANPLPADLLIIDESSMIDAALFAKLLDALSDHTRIILIGDKDQLASVEAGSLFGDLCQSLPQINAFERERIAFLNSFIPSERRQLTGSEAQTEHPHPLFQHIVELQHSHRFKRDAGIGKLSYAVIHNQADQIRKFYGEDREAELIIDPDYSEVVFEAFADRYAAYIQEPDIRLALRKLADTRVLCAIREGEQGLYTLNRKIEQRLAEKKLVDPREEFYENKPVILSKNHYDLGLFNGDIGIVRREEGYLKVFFEDAAGEIRSVLPGLISHYETVFAMTVHKSQGSEFDEVMLILPRQAVPLLTRELLYTGITRARSRLILSAPEELVLLGAEARVQRASGIAERFEQEGESWH